MLISIIINNQTGTLKVKKAPRAQASDNGGTITNSEANVAGVTQKEKVGQRWVVQPAPTNGYSSPCKKSTYTPCNRAISLMNLRVLDRFFESRAASV